MNNNEVNFEMLKRDILFCTDCEEKFGFKPIPIVHGNAKSKILQISQAPSCNVHITRKPFNDSTGKKLKYEWYKIKDNDFYNESNFYISALSHCFPGKSKNGGDKSPPISCAKKWLKKEIEVVEKQLFVVIGGKAAKFLFPNYDYTELIFKDNKINGILAIVLPHPSPLNVKWFIEHPDFEKKRLPQIRKIIWDVLDIK